MARFLWVLDDEARAVITADTTHEAEALCREQRAWDCASFAGRDEPNDEDRNDADAPHARDTLILLDDLAQIRRGPNGTVVETEGGA